MAGAAPSFGRVHLARTLLVLGVRQTGRKALVKILGVGEGSVRTIIKKLSKEGLVESKPRGHELSAKGRRVVSSYLEKFTLPEILELDIAPNKRCCIIVLHDAVDKVTTGLDERELAVKTGADGAILLKNSRKGLIFPCDDILLDGYPETKNFLSEKKLVENDLIVISFSDSEVKAVDGALAIALKLTERL